MKMNDSTDNGGNIMSLCVHIASQINKIAQLYQTGTTFCFSHKGLSAKIIIFLHYKPIYSNMQQATSKSVKLCCLSNVHHNLYF